MIIEEIEIMRNLTQGVQKEYYDKMLADCKKVNVVSLYDVFTKFQVDSLRRLLKPKVRECYRNAVLLSLNRNATYCEGKVCQFGISMDHAFNRIGDKYVDITYELVLGLDVTKIEYAVLGEYTSRQAMDVAMKLGYYGSVYQYESMKALRAFAHVNVNL